MKRKQVSEWLILQRFPGCYVLVADNEFSRACDDGEIILKEFEADGILAATKVFNQWEKEFKCQNKRDI